MQIQKIVLFDFDGVIVDSSEIGYEITRKAHPQLTREQHKELFEGNIYDEMEKLEKDTPSSEKAFFDEYVPRLFEIDPIEGIAGALKELSNAYQLVVVSSTISSPIQGYLNMHGLARHFDWIMGGDTHKSKTVKIQMVLEEYKARPEEAIFITDTLGDIREAATCKVRSIAVTWGLHEKERLQKADPFALVDRMEDLLPAVHSFFG